METSKTNSEDTPSLLPSEKQIKEEKKNEEEERGVGGGGGGGVLVVFHG